MVHSAALSVQPVSGYSYLGCFSDKGTQLLNATSTAPTNPYPQYCCDWCVNTNTSYTYCGVEGGNECFCDTTVHTGKAKTVPASECDSTCPGVPGGGTYQCGGNSRLNLYSATVPASSAPASKTLTEQSISGYSYVGCFSDATSRILSGALTLPALNDPKYCCEWCLNINNNFKYCGVEYGIECRCDSTTSSANSAADSECSKPCAGAGGFQCGGFYLMNLYKATGFSETATKSSVRHMASATNTSPATSESAGSGGKGGLGGGSIAGIVIGVVAGVLLAAGCVFLLIRRRRSQPPELPASPAPPAPPAFTNGTSIQSPKPKSVELFTQDNTHEMQAPLGAEPEQATTIHELDAGIR
ncbi:hypothetical protein BGZ63DRAFT_389591 [Mariannaea sp. PMI_226]|nr:hypothetical protein BGZ63DRAFT_389591 [Mariannaea sp. PMI_226]